MDTEYPAAHSMDTDWFAIDANGEIGYFSSGAEGVVPEGYERDYWLFDFFDDICDLNLALDYKPPGDYESFDIEPHTLGLHQYDTWGPQPYSKEKSPQVPLNIKELPSDIRDKVSRIVFEHLEFSTTSKIQPCEHFKECRHYGSDDWYGTDGECYRQESEESEQRREIVTHNLIEKAKSEKQKQSEPDSRQAPPSPPPSSPPV